MGRGWGKAENKINALSFLFSNAGVDFSATFIAALLLPICYRYAVYVENV